MEEFIEIRCPNLPKGNTFECRHLLGGISKEHLDSYDYTNPYVAIFYCQNCGVMWQVEAFEKNGVLNFSMIPKDVKVDFVDALEYFELIAVDGCRRKK